MKSLLRCTCCSAFLALLLVGCAEKAVDEGLPSPNVYAITATDTSSSALTAINTPNCVLEVEPGQIKKCQPELDSLTTGISGQFQIDGISPHRNWAPMMALEFSSQDDAQKLRLKFNITAYKIDADGQAVLQETPFKGIAEMWVNKELQWSVDLPVEVMPAQPFNFVVVWGADQTLELRLAQTAWKTVPVGFEVAQVSLMASGVMASTDHLAILQKQ